MTSEQNREEDQSTTSSPAVGLSGIVERYRKIREHAETYPYVWASYIVVYGGFSLWLTYRWRKLRKTEDRVRVLQERLRKLVENEESSGSAGKASQSVDKTSKNVAEEVKERFAELAMNIMARDIVAASNTNVDDDDQGIKTISEGLV